MEKPEQVEDEVVSDENCPEDLTSQEDIDKSNASKYVLDGVQYLIMSPGKTRFSRSFFKTTSVM